MNRSRSRLDRLHHTDFQLGENGTGRAGYQGLGRVPSARRSQRLLLIQPFVVSRRIRPPLSSSCWASRWSGSYSSVSTTGNTCYMILLTVQPHALGHYFTRSLSHWLVSVLYRISFTSYRYSLHHSNPQVLTRTFVRRFFNVILRLCCFLKFFWLNCLINIL